MAGRPLPARLILPSRAEADAARSANPVSNRAELKDKGTEPRRGARGRVRPHFIILAVPLLLAPPATAKPADLVVPERPDATLPPPCAGAAAERTALEAERTALNRTIGDIAVGRHRPRRNPSGGEVAAGVAGAAASVLLPFGVGALLGAGASAAEKSGRRKKPAPAGPDVAGMIDRLGAIDARLAALAGCP